MLHKTVMHLSSSRWRLLNMFLIQERLFRSGGEFTYANFWHLCKEFVFLEVAGFELQCTAVQPVLVGVGIFKKKKKLFCIKMFWALKSNLSGENWLIFRPLLVGVLTGGRVEVRKRSYIRDV